MHESSCTHTHTHTQAHRRQSRLCAVVGGVEHGRGDDERGDGGQHVGHVDNSVGVGGGCDVVVCRVEHSGGDDERGDGGQNQESFLKCLLAVMMFNFTMV